MSKNDTPKPTPSGNGWVSCGIPANDQEYGAFWTQWAASRDSRKCLCGRMVLTGPCPDCGREYKTPSGA